MNIKQAQRYGVQAFELGKGRAPAQSAEFLRKVYAIKRETDEVLDLFSAFSYGWDIANLADGCTDPEMPSVIALEAILN